MNQRFFDVIRYILAPYRSEMFIMISVRNLIRQCVKHEDVTVPFVMSVHVRSMVPQLLSVSVPVSSSSTSETGTISGVLELLVW